MPSRISAFVITRDEEHNIEGCLESLRGLEAEIVVLDDSTDGRTRELARKYTDKVSRRPFDDFASQKQAALDLCGGDWALSIDADERLTPELREEIPAALSRADEGIGGFSIPFRVRFLGRCLRFGGLGGERHLRLFRKAGARFTGRHLHEGIRVDGRIARLHGAMLHTPYRDLDEYLEKMRRYTTRAALQRYENGRRFRAVHHLLPFWELLRRLLLRGGIFDGTPGVVWAGLSAMHTWIKYLKLRELEDEGAP